MPWPIPAWQSGYQFMVRYNFISRDEGNRKAKEAILKAIELDSSLGEAYAILGLIRFTIDWDLYGPDELFRKAISLSPGNALIYADYAQYLRWMGRYDRGIEMAERAIELDPLTPMTNWWLPAILSFAGRYDESIPHYRHVLELDPNYFHTYAYLAFNYTLKGSYGKKAIHYADKALSFNEVMNSRGYLPSLIWVYIKSGEMDRAQELITHFEKLCENAACDPASYSLIYFGLGDYERAFEYLDEGYEQRSGQTIYLRVIADYLLKDISSDPRVCGNSQENRIQRLTREGMYQSSMQSMKESGNGWRRMICCN